ncbi:LexA family protein [Grimontia hollisae]|uniref:LexA family protein n=1 Tax=Grimontia hollisae TaxID=673 RepID=UPI0013033C2C|nr:S24 family peptidase [Grimontia hollisae]
MKKIEDVRLENARMLLTRFDTLADFAEAVGRSATQMSRVMGKNPTKIIGGRLARHIELSLGLDEGWMDQDRSSTKVTITAVSDLSASYSPEKEAGYPLISKVQAGNWGSIIETDIASAKRFPCPIPCGPRTFVLEVDGVSMEPDFKDGYLIWVDPDKQYVNKSLVVARLDDRDEATFKQLIVEDGIKMLKPLNKDWPEQYVQINGNCTIVGVVVFGGRAV